MKDDEIKAIMKLLWFNSMIQGWLLSICVVMLLSIWVPVFWFQAVAFLIVSTVVYIKWDKMDHKIRNLFENET